MDKVIAFDMDGVIADTIGALYRCYLDFLRRYDVAGSEEEFNQLNGPKVSEIVSYLKKTYDLPPAEEQLESEYLHRVEHVYDDVEPVSNVQEVIRQLQARNVPLALASSSPTAVIQRVLERFELDGCFATIVSGDDVQQAKPAADIYRAVQRQFPGQKVYVIEDAPLGVAAAQAAGLEVIFFDPAARHQQQTLYQCQSMNEVLQVMEEILGSAQIVTTFQEIELNFKQQELPWSGEQREIVEQIWQQEQKQNPQLFNGQVTGHLSHRQDGNTLAIQCLPLEYKYVVAQFRDADLKGGVTPLGVSGIVVDRSGRTLLGRRSSVTQYQGWYELVPSGALNGQGIVDQIRQELTEETRLNPSLVISVDPFCLILDEAQPVYDVGCIIQLDLDATSAETGVTAEYENLQWVDLSELDQFMAARSCIPTSRALWQAFQQCPQPGH